MKILITTPMMPPSIGGPATYVALLQKELPKRGIDVEVVSFDALAYLPKGLKHLVFFFRVLKVAKNVDIVFGQDPVSVGLPTLFVSRLRRKKFIIRVAGDYAWEQANQRFGVKDDVVTFQGKTYSSIVNMLKVLERYVARHADAIVVPSKFLGDIVSSWITHKEKVNVINNGIDVSALPRAQVRWGDDHRIMVTAGRLIALKRFGEVIDVVAKLPTLWNLQIIGDGPEMRSLEQRIHDLHLESRVELTGALSRADLLRHLLQADLFVLNSEVETFSFQTIEAMAVGLPVIVTDVGGLPEIIHDGIDGLLIDANNPQAIETAVERYEDQSFRQEVMKNGRMRAQEFSIEKTVNAVVALLKTI